jgi:hypothetical protein
MPTTMKGTIAANTSATIILRNINLPMRSLVSLVNITAVKIVGPQAFDKKAMKAQFIKKINTIAKGYKHTYEPTVTGVR